MTRHPTVANTPLKVTLLSPAQRPIQITRDLPGFWSGSYADVQQGHARPVSQTPLARRPDPVEDPTLRAKRRK